MAEMGDASHDSLTPSQWREALFMNPQFGRDFQREQVIIAQYQAENRTNRVRLIIRTALTIGTLGGYEIVRRLANRH